jgi:hypothetical protein
MYPLARVVVGAMRRRHTTTPPPGMIGTMRRLAVLVLVVVVPLAACGGRDAPYYADDDAGNCVHHPGAGEDCTVCPGPCGDDASVGLTTCYLVSRTMPPCAN